MRGYLATKFRAGMVGPRDKDILDNLERGTAALDTISEKTAAAGVTIDSVLLKDNEVTANKAITDAVQTKTSSGTFNFNNQGGSSRGSYTDAGAWSFLLSTSSPTTITDVVKVKTASGALKLQTSGGTDLLSADNSGFFTFGLAASVSTGNHTYWMSSGSGAAASGLLFKTVNAFGSNGATNYCGWADGSTVRAEVGATIQSASNSCGYLYFGNQGGSQANASFWQRDGILYTSATTANVGSSTGTVVGTQTSDFRAKIVHGTNTYGLEEVLKIETVRYSLRKRPDVDRVGFVAQQLSSVVPEAVYNTGRDDCLGLDDVLAVDDSNLVPVLVKAIQELSEKLDEANARIQQLESTLASMLARLDALEGR